MIERVVKSEQGKAIDPDEHLSSQPLNFQFYYANKEGKTEILNTFYLEDGNPKLDLYLEVFNESDKSITFQTSAGRLSTVQAGGTSAASAERCHFSVRWEKDIVIKPSEFSVEPKEWQVNYDEDDHFFTLYFFHKSGFVLRPQNSDNGSDRVLLTLKNFTANNRAVKSTNVEMLYGSPLLLNDGEEFTETLSIKNTISVTNHPDYKNIPLQVRFIGPNTILNDETTNSLKLQIVNRPPSNNTRPNLLLNKANSKFIVGFDMGDGAEALTTSPRANNVTITSTDANNWKVDKTQNAAEWTVKLNNSSNKDKLISQDNIELEIKNFVTSNPSGVAYLYITYQNIGNYPDGQLVVPIEKTPLLYRGAQVGIGTTNPSAKLHVSGGDALIGGKLTSTGDATIGGKVGIGTTSPSAKLEVKLADTTTTDSSLKLEHNGSNFTVSPHRGGGNNSTIIQNTGGGSLIINPSSGNVGIGTTAPSAKLHVSGGDAIVSGRLAIGTTVSSHIHLTIGDDDTGLKQQGDGKLAIYTNNAERVRIDENGNVAIGTTDLTHRLHIGGKNSTLRLSGEGTYGVGATLNFGDNQEVYIKEDEDKKLLIHADTRISLESSVGIGTKNPSAKLHVSGGNAIFSDKVGIGITTPSANAAPKIHLAIGDDDTGLQQQGDGKLAIYTDNVERVRIEKNGNVGIGTTDPKQKLHVQGRIRLSDVPVWDGGGGYDLTWVAHGYDGANENDSRWNCIAREGSSERYKQNIAPLEDDFQKLLSLQPKQYQMKEGYGDPNTWEFGYLAEDLDKVGLKSLVIYNQSGQPDGIQYKKMCIYLNEVVKGQQSSMERLEEKVNELNEKLMSSL